MLQIYFGTLVCQYYGDNIKYKLLSKHFFQKKEQYGGLKKPQTNDKLSLKVMFYTYMLHVFTFTKKLCYLGSHIFSCLRFSWVSRSLTFQLLPSAKLYRVYQEINILCTYYTRCICYMHWTIHFILRKHSLVVIDTKSSLIRLCKITLPFSVLKTSGFALSVFLGNNPS